MIGKKVFVILASRFNDTITLNIVSETVVRERKILGETQYAISYAMCFQWFDRENIFETEAQAKKRLTEVEKSLKEIVNFIQSPDHFVGSNLE